MVNVMGGWAERHHCICNYYGIDHKGGRVIRSKQYLANGYSDVQKCTRMSGR